MKLIQAVFSIAFIFVVYILVLPRAVSAISYDLIAPSGVLTRGQDVQFIVNIDSEGGSITSAQVGMTFQNQYLQYVSTTPGDAMVSVTATQSDDKTLLLTGTNTPGFNGTGVFAYVTFKIIAQAPGTAELCAIFVPSTTPSPAPTGVTPLPTQLPVTGTVENNSMITIVGGALLLSSLTSYVLVKRSKSVYPRHKQRTKN